MLSRKSSFSGVLIILCGVNVMVCMLLLEFVYINSRYIHNRNRHGYSSSVISGRNCNYSSFLIDNFFINSSVATSKVTRSFRNGTSVFLEKFQPHIDLDHLVRLIRYDIKIKNMNLEQAVRKFRFVTNHDEKVQRRHYDFLVTPSHFCNTFSYYEKNFLLFMVKSRYDNSHGRHAIRKTWGNETYLKSFKFRTVFIIGRQGNQNSHQITKEIKEFNDIIQISAIDSYFNNTLKTMARFEWASQYCGNNTKFVMMVDDDFFVSPEGLIKLLRQKPTASQIYMGVVYSDAIPDRYKFNPYYMPVHDYPYDSYPPFIPAGAIIMSMEFVQNVNIAMRFVKPFKFDDVYIGIIAYLLDVSPSNVEEIYISKHLATKKHFNDFHKVIACHKIKNNELLNQWNKHLQHYLRHPSERVL